jgi:hypothetical protein
MKTVPRRHYTLSVCAGVAVLAGCGVGSTQALYQPPGSSQSTWTQSVSSTTVVPGTACQGQQAFSYTGHAQNFAVPKCVASIYVNAKGASGELGGDGGEVSATVPLTPGETLTVTVGGAGHNSKGGFNGGATGAKHNKRHGGGGGGASDVRKGGSMLMDRVVVAGGGGGEGEGDGPSPGTGGTGGGLPDGGAAGAPTFCMGSGSTGGGGGTQSSGGMGGAGSNGGSLGNGGVGVGDCSGFPIPPKPSVYWSGGGGGGYYGGGGGGNGGGGGGGSGYAEPAASNVTSQSGVNSGNGSVTICWGYSNGECGSRQRH